MFYNNKKLCFDFILEQNGVNIKAFKNRLIPKLGVMP